MLEYEVTYETQNGNHTTINVITSSLIKAATVCRKLSI